MTDRKFLRPHLDSRVSGTVRLSDLARAILEKGVCVRFCANGQSMFPCIRDGDIITIEPVRHPAAVYGDIVACYSLENQSLFVHRIIKKMPQGYLLRGDNRCSSDGFSTVENILGRVVKIERDGRTRSFGIGIERIILALLSRLSVLHRLNSLGKKLF
jgi:hypothetical protein